MVLCTISINKYFKTPASSRNLTVVFQTFPGQIILLFPDFQGILFIFMWRQTVQNWLLNAEIFCTMYSSLLIKRMGVKFLNFELQMLCVMNCEKIINKCMGNQQCNRHLHFPGQHYSFPEIFPDFSTPMIIFKAFQGFENFYIKFQDFPYCSRICTNHENCEKFAAYEYRAR